MLRPYLRTGQALPPPQLPTSLVKSHQGADWYARWTAWSNGGGDARADRDPPYATEQGRGVAKHTPTPFLRALEQSAGVYHLSALYTVAGMTSWTLDNHRPSFCWPSFLRFQVKAAKQKGQQ